MSPRSPLVFLVALLTTVPAARAELPDAASSIRPLMVGAEIPDTPLRTADDEAVTVHGSLGDGPAVLVFYRGGW